jgi:chitinase
MGSTEFSAMVHDSNLRSKFVRTAIDFLKKNKFDGLDLDWEYPANREGSQPSDRELFTTLCSVSEYLSALLNVFELF